LSDVRRHGLGEESMRCVGCGRYFEPVLLGIHKERGCRGIAAEFQAVTAHSQPASPHDPKQDVVTFDGKDIRVVRPETMIPNYAVEDER
jgi:hypothetical protein